uniref:Putative ovule protein n=1 Tax=Solanum chacoense TaxID=4108 RepID=A0A0V0H1T5_SOLCH
MSTKTSMCFFHKNNILLETNLWSWKSCVLVAPIVCTRRCWHHSLHITRMKSLHVTAYQSLAGDLICGFVPDIH